MKRKQTAKVLRQQKVRFILKEMKGQTCDWTVLKRGKRYELSLER